jgi:hypothetical protein
VSLLSDIPQALDNAQQSILSLILCVLLADLCVDVTQVGPQQAHEMNMCGSAYGMSGNDFYTFLTGDIEEKESLRQAREQEEEKAMYSVSLYC